jgi:hypothetical protein
MPYYNSTTYRMNPEAKSLWLELMLTTYRDKQCKGAAVNRAYGATCNHYCVMGLLCVAYAIAHDLNPDSYVTHANINQVANEVFKWAGLNSRDGAYRLDSGFASTLVCQNDIGCTFQGLATIIQENF